MKTIFVSGTCRACTVVFDGRGKLQSIHSQRIFDAPNINFLGNFSSVKGHIQFIKFLQKKIELPEQIQRLRFPYMSIPLLGGEHYTVPERIEIIRELLPKCDIFLFEICSRKNYKVDFYGINKEITVEDCINDDNKTPYNKDSFEDIYNDIDVLCNLLPKGTKIVLQTHFRIDIITGDKKNFIESREIIYNAVKKNCEDNPEIKHFDPTFLLRDNRGYMQDNEHFTTGNLDRVFDYLYANYIES